MLENKQKFTLENPLFSYEDIWEYTSLSDNDVIINNNILYKKNVPLVVNGTYLKLPNIINYASNSSTLSYWTKQNFIRIYTKESQEFFNIENQSYEKLDKKFQYFAGTINKNTEAHLTRAFEYSSFPYDKNRQWNFDVYLKCNTNKYKIRYWVQLGDYSEIITLTYNALTDTIEEMSDTNKNFKIISEKCTKNRISFKNINTDDYYIGLHTNLHIDITNLDDSSIDVSCSNIMYAPDNTNDNNSLCLHSFYKNSRSEDSNRIYIPLHKLQKTGSLLIHGKNNSTTSKNNIFKFVEFFDNIENENIGYQYNQIQFIQDIQNKKNILKINNPLNSSSYNWFIKEYSKEVYNDYFNIMFAWDEDYFYFIDDDFKKHKIKKRQNYNLNFFSFNYNNKDTTLEYFYTWDKCICESKYLQYYLRNSIKNRTNNILLTDIDPNIYDKSYDILPTMFSNTRCDILSGDNMIEVSASSQYDSNYNPWEAFNKTETLSDQSNCWISQANQIKNQWIKFKFKNNKKYFVTKIKFQQRIDTSIYQTANEFILQGSNDDINWNNIYRFTINEPFIQNKWYEFIIKNIDSFTFYNSFRIYFQQVESNAIFIQAQNIFLYGFCEDDYIDNKLSWTKARLYNESYNLLFNMACDYSDSSIADVTAKNIYTDVYPIQRMLNTWKKSNDKDSWHTQTGEGYQSFTINSNSGKYILTSFEIESRWYDDYYTPRYFRILSDGVEIYNATQYPANDQQKYGSIKKHIIHKFHPATSFTLEVTGNDAHNNQYAIIGRFVINGMTEEEYNNIINETSPKIIDITTIDEKIYDKSFTINSNIEKISSNVFEYAFDEFKYFISGIKLKSNLNCDIIKIEGLTSTNKWIQIYEFDNLLNSKQILNIDKTWWLQFYTKIRITLLNELSKITDLSVLYSDKDIFNFDINSIELLGFSNFDYKNKKLYTWNKQLELDNKPYLKGDLTSELQLNKLITTTNDFVSISSNDGNSWKFANINSSNGWEFNTTDRYITIGFKNSQEYIFTGINFKVLNTNNLPYSVKLEGYDNITRNMKRII